MHQPLAGVLACGQLGGPAQSAQSGGADGGIVSHALSRCAPPSRTGTWQRVHQHLRQSRGSRDAARCNRRRPKVAGSNCSRRSLPAMSWANLRLRLRDRVAGRATAGANQRVAGTSRKPSSPSARSAHHARRPDHAGRRGSPGSPGHAPRHRRRHVPSQRSRGCCAWSRCCSLGNGHGTEVQEVSVGCPLPSGASRRGALSLLWLGPGRAQERHTAQQAVLRRAAAVVRGGSLSLLLPQPAVRQGQLHRPAAGLAPYSPYRTELHLLAVQMYAWGYSTYRRTGAALGVPASPPGVGSAPGATPCCPWPPSLAWSDRAASSASTRSMCSCPRTTNLPATMRRWMYVYLAVDVWTYDLLHIALYPHNSADSAQAFLLALRTKGYHPQVIVTDLRQDYGPVIAQVFPQAAITNASSMPSRTAQRHHQGRLRPWLCPKSSRGRRPSNSKSTPSLTPTRPPWPTHATPPCSPCARTMSKPHPPPPLIFDFLERHWPKLANSIGSDPIPATNNAVERVIRRFHQHYQCFCGFESAQHAQAYLAVFEKFYRFTPFSQDAQPRIRGKSPLQLAGYDVAHLPYVHPLCRPRHPLAYDSSSARPCPQVVTLSRIALPCLRHLCYNCLGIML